MFVGHPDSPESSFCAAVGAAGSDLAIALSSDTPKDVQLEALRVVERAAAKNTSQTTVSHRTWVSRGASGRVALAILGKTMCIYASR